MYQYWKCGRTFSLQKKGIMVTSVDDLTYQHYIMNMIGTSLSLSEPHVVTMNGDFVCVTQTVVLGM